MGIYDRDYYRNDPDRGGFGNVRLLSVTTWLIVINVAVLVGDGLLQRHARRPPVYSSDEWVDEEGRELDEEGRKVVEMMDHVIRNAPRDGQSNAALYEWGMGPLKRWGYFSLDKAVYGLQAWRFLTFQFLHAGLGHIFGNMLGLLFFGPIVEGHFGRARFLAFYLLCGVAGALSYVILFAAGVFDDAAVPMVGASAGVFGVLVAAAYIAPDVEITLWFPAIPIKLAHLALIMMGLAAYTVFVGGHNSGGEAAHLGGGLLGLGFMLNQHWLNPFATSRRGGAGARRRRKRVQFKDWSKDLNR
jgi:membrane associated rhomboid family serine protease